MKKKRIVRVEERKARMRLRWIEHREKVTGKVTQTCRYFGVSRSSFYFWYKRYKEGGIQGLYDRPVGPKSAYNRTPQNIVDLILAVRRQKQYGAPRMSWYLQRHYNIYISSVTISRIFRANKVPRAIPHHDARLSTPVIAQKQVPGERIQVDVKFLPKLAQEQKRYYQFTAIDDCTRYRILQVYSHNSIKSAVDFVEKLREKLPFAIKEIQTDHGSEFATPFTWHLNDLGITHRRIYPGCPKQNGKVERSHRTDEEEFYRRHQFADKGELEQRIKEGEKEYNFDRPHTALKGLTPGEKLHKILKGGNN